MTATTNKSEESIDQIERQPVQEQMVLTKKRPNFVTSTFALPQISGMNGQPVSILSALKQFDLNYVFTISFRVSDILQQNYRHIASVQIRGQI